MSVESLAEMRSANGGHYPSVDYLHYAVRAAGLGADFAASLTDFLNPSLVPRESRVLVESVGALARYQIYRSQGQSEIQAEYWANLTEISGLLTDSNDLEQARKLAQVICWAWQNALVAQHPDATQIVRILEECSESEVYVTVSAPDAP